jgi:hypothetical protein
MTLNNKIINPYSQRLIFNGKSKKNPYISGAKLITISEPLIAIIELLIL